MRSRIHFVLTLFLMVASSAQAQSAGDHGRGDRGGPPSGDAPPPNGAPSPPIPKLKPVNQVEIIGVVTAIDPASERVTIAYEAVEALNWPPGAMPFAVSKTDLLNGVTVGERVRFKLDSQQISDLKPFGGPRPSPADAR